MNKANSKLLIKVNKAVDPSTNEELQSYTYSLFYKGFEVQTDTLNTMFECEQEACNLFGVNNYSIEIKE